MKPAVELVRSESRPNAPRDPAEWLPQRERQLLDPDVWRDTLEKYARATNLAVALTDAEGRPLGECINPRPTWNLFRRQLPTDHPGCPFCLARSSVPCHCIADCLARGELVLVHSPIGMVHFAVPLLLDCQPVGALIGGQVFDQFPEQLALERMAQQLELPALQAWHLARGEQPIKQATVRVYADLLAALGRTVLQARHHQLVEADRLAEMTRLQDLLQQRNQELIEADQRKDEFMAVLGHELRNPLAPIRNTLQLMKLWDLVDADVHWAIAVMDRQTNQLTRLVDDLLDLSRVAQNKVELHKQAVQVTVVVDSAVEMARPLIDSRRHELSVVLPESPLTLNADPVRLAQVLANLLNNAAKYTPPGGRIELRAATEGSEVVFRVRDNGIGIAPEMLPRVFHLFVQAEEATDLAAGGLGIGLSLVHSLVTMHGGSVQVFSEGLGKGSELVVRLPISSAVAAASPDSSAEERRIAKRSLRVLLADDQSDAAESLAVLLRMWRHETRVAADGPTALILAQQALPDVAILDINLPGMDGHEVARHLRRLPDGDRVFLVALTGHGSSQDRRRSRESGFDVHLIKPIDPEELRRLLECPPTESKPLEREEDIPFVAR